MLKENFEADVKHRIGDAMVINLTREALQGCIDAPRNAELLALRRTSTACFAG